MLTTTPNKSCMVERDLNIKSDERSYIVYPNNHVPYILNRQKIIKQRRIRFYDDNGDVKLTTEKGGAGMLERWIAKNAYMLFLLTVGHWNHQQPFL